MHNFYIQSFSLTECILTVWVPKHRDCLCVGVPVCLPLCVPVCVDFDSREKVERGGNGLKKNVHKRISSK